MSAPSAPSRALTALRPYREQQEAVVRWLRPLVPAVLAVVVWAAFQADPRPGIDGPELAVSIALAGLLVGGLGGLAASRRPAVHLAFVVLLFASSVALVWLQPDGTGVAGIFVGMSFLARLARGHLSIPLAVIALLVLGMVLASGGPGAVTDALLNAIMLGAFYGTMLLAIRVGEANQRAQELVVELDRSRGAEARAAGLAERQRLAREMHDVLAYEPSATRLTVEDVGAAPSPAGDGGYGLTGMRERAELLGGTLTAGPTPTGFRVELELPA